MSVAKVDRLRAFLESGKWDQLRIRDAILEARLTSACKLTLLAIVSHHSDEHPQPSVGLRRLAALASLKTDTVNAALSKLQELGLVAFERRARVLNRYDLTPAMKGLLSVPPFGTEPGRAPRSAVPSGHTGSVPGIGTDEWLAANSSVPIGGTICPDRGPELSQGGTQKEPARNQMKEPTLNASENAGTETRELPQHVRNFEASFGPAHADDREAFARWVKRFGKTGVRLDAKRARCLEDRRLEGMTLDDFDAALEGAAVDQWLATIGFKLSVIVGDRERFEDYRDRGRAIRAGTYRPPAKPGTPEPVQPRSGWQPKASAFR